ncbi:MAG: 16S rRNA (guanine(966)-N(2))-methyltransferase RsmD [Desulfobulbus sp.]|nr:MAG: 16S rRNA (guanine(966)-N(2))-methyltransferase RsmD [Desulfobulbus sp.]
MRITGGSVRGRTLRGPKGTNDTIRPTSDRVREALFSILGDRVRDARVLDLFAGTGSLGLEALSRGAASAVFIDRSPTALDLIRANLLHCGITRAELYRIDLTRPAGYSNLARRLAPGRQFDLVFLDPPYEKNLADLALKMVENTGLVAPGGLVVAEERGKVILPDPVGSLRLLQHRRYGETSIWLYSIENSAT